jgi:hypothetical protein
LQESAGKVYKNQGQIDEKKARASMITYVILVVGLLLGTIFWLNPSIFACCSGQR